MSLQTIIEVAIGLVFTWLVLSIAAMYIQELIVTKLRWRSNMLESYIHNMMADPELAAKIYSHPLIQALHSGEDGKHKPSYIPAREFTLVLFDITVNAGLPTSILRREINNLLSQIETLQEDQKERARAQFLLVIATAQKALDTVAGETALQEIVDNFKTQIGELAKSYPVLDPVVQNTLSKTNIQKDQLIAVLKGIQNEIDNSAGQDGEENNTSTLNQIRNGIAVLATSHPQLSQAMESLLLGAEEYTSSGEIALAHARDNVEKWFNDGMDRLSGWYKRRSQKLGFVIGFAVAVALNADTVALAQTLWREPAIRQALVTQAETYTQQNQNGVQPATAEELNILQLQFSNLNVPFGWIGSPLSTDSGGNISMPDGSLRQCTLWPTSASTQYYGLKLGSECYPIINAPAPNDLTGILLKLFGLLASGLAAAQGAPFWFDILKKAINVRTSGVNPSETPEQQPAG